MAQFDKQRWDKKYQTNKIPTKVSEIIKEYAPLAKGKKALDIACGMGRHSKYLAQMGFSVDAFDISPIALESLSHIDNIYTKEVDFDNYKLLENRYDLIICINFLNRNLFPQIYNALKQGGLFIFESFIYHPQNTKAPSNHNFLLQQGELEKLIKNDYKIINIKEFWNDGIYGDKLFKCSFVGYKVY